MSVGSMQAVILCRHVAEDPERMARGSRSAPVAPEDSGWVFYCADGDHTDETGAQVWCVSDLLRLEPGLSNLLNSPVESTVHKDNLGHWLRS